MADKKHSVLRSVGTSIGSFLTSQTQKFKQALWISLAAIGLSFFLIGLAHGIKHFADVTFLDPEANTDGNFDVYDLFFLYRQRHYQRVNSDIVVVDTEGLTRKQLADGLEVMLESHPKVIGLDVWMKPGAQDDSLSTARIKDIIAKSGNVVSGYPIRVVDDSLKLDLGHLSVGVERSRLGFNVLQFKDSLITIRKAPMWTILDKDTLFSLTAQLLRVIAPVHLKRIKGEQEVRINYRAMERDEPFQTIRLADLLGFSREEIRRRCFQKVVLFGSLERTHTRDRHYTPLNVRPAGHALPDMAGVLIHAQLLSTYLKNDFMIESWMVADVLFAFAFTWLVAVLLLTVHKHLTRWYALLRIPIFMVFSIGIFYIAIRLFDHSIMLSLHMVLLPVWLAGEAREVVHDWPKKSSANTVNHGQAA